MTTFIFNAQSAIRISGAVLLSLLPALAWAHTNDDGVGFISGLVHPIAGTDHLLAMLSVGIVSAQIGGRAMWTVPMYFVAAMVCGGILGFVGMQGYAIEAGIALSVVTLGIAIIVGNRGMVPIIVPVLVIGFGLFHGYAHGREMPESASPVFYSFGFIVATSSIHLLGVAIGDVFTAIVTNPRWLASIGVAIAGSGLLILSGV